MSLPDRSSVAVIGAGFSGLMTALHLLERQDGPRVHLVERGPDVGRGVAYARGGEDYRLNVRARNMSAWPDRPDDFARWVADAGEAAPDGFASRAAYGAYLQALLRRCANDDRLVTHRDAAVDLAPRSGGGWVVRLAGGEGLEVDAAVLAIGNLAPSTPRGVDEGARATPAYVADPWASDLAALPQSGCAVLLGTGLTMIDVALRLSRVRPGLKLLALSRRGLVPRRHMAPPPPESEWRPQSTSPLPLLREVRARAARENWRAVIDALRPHAQHLWRGWSAAERGSFLRHLRPWWDVHRHRLAPEVANRLDRLVESGGLALASGRLVRVAAAGAGLQVTWRPRHEEERTLAAAALVNCTGPNADVTRADEALLHRLLERGLMRPDPLRLGFDVDLSGRLVGANGRASHTLFAVGPMTRGASWEITSVPDIRGQAAECADAVMAALAPETVAAE